MILKAAGINRIRLEFKVFLTSCRLSFRISINRIRLEFKGELEGIKMALKRVLIESDWNLKNRVQFTDFL